MMGYLTLMLLGIASYLLVPAIGPESYFADQYTRELNGHPVIHGVDYIMRAGRVGYDCFPSLHVGIPLLLSFYLRDTGENFSFRRSFTSPSCAAPPSICATTIVVDVLASFLYAPAAYWLNDFLLSHWPGERIHHRFCAQQIPRPKSHSATNECSTNSPFPNSPRNSPNARSPPAKPCSRASTKSRAWTARSTPSSATMTADALAQADAADKPLPPA